MDSRPFDRFLSSALTIGLCLCASSAWAVIHHVPDEHGTIQEGISAAGTGDTVLVAAREYAGGGNRDLDFGGVDLVLFSESGPELTIIDCGGYDVDSHRNTPFLIDPSPYDPAV